MRLVCASLLLAAAALAAGGCGRPFDGPTVDAFIGRVVQNGKPVQVGEGASLHVFHEKGTSFGIPLQSDGTFKIGWMPIGKYSVMFKRATPKANGQPVQHSVPGGLTIQEGQTEYTIELGKGWKV